MAENTPEKEKKSIIVTSTHTVDFPSLNWGIHAGEFKELPANAAVQKFILSKDYISVKN